MSLDQLLSNDSSTLNFPTIRPTLDLNFARTKSLDPRITFTRSSGGSYAGPDGIIKYAGVNQPRFDHDPSTGESLGLLIEEQRTNIVANSTTVSSHTKQQTKAVITTETTSPEGTYNAYKIIGNYGETARESIFTNRFTMNANTSYTASVFLKGTEARRYVVMWFDGTPLGNSPVEGPFYGSSVFIDLLTGTNNNPSIVKMIPYGNGWYRCYLTATVGALNLTNANLNVSIGAPNGFLSTATPDKYKYIGDGTSGIYYWGSQVEEGAFPTSYIPTQDSTRTRAADNVSMTGTKFSSWYNSREGTYLTSHRQLDTKNSNVNYGIFASRDNELTSRIRLFAGAGRTAVFNIINLDINNNIYNFISSVYLSANGDMLNQENILQKIICAYSSRDAVRILNNNALTFDNSVTLPITPYSNIILGGADGGVTYLNGTISRFTYYPKRLPNSQLQALTK